jgi:hypothetical protein
VETAENHGMYNCSSSCSSWLAVRSRGRGLQPLEESCLVVVPLNIGKALIYVSPGNLLSELD